MCLETLQFLCGKSLHQLYFGINTVRAQTDLKPKNDQLMAQRAKYNEFVREMGRILTTW